MRHLKHRHQLGRKKEHRQALMANMAAALLTHDRIRTTLPKAKALRPYIEKVITLAKKAQNTTPERAVFLRRLAVAKVRDEAAVALLFREKVSEFADRPGGYTRIYKLGNRVGDAAEMAVIQLVPGSDEGYAKKKRSSPKKAKEETPVVAEAEVVEPVAEQSEASEETKASEAVAAVAESSEVEESVAEVSEEPGSTEEDSEKK